MVRESAMGRVMHAMAAIVAAIAAFAAFMGLGAQTALADDATLYAANRVTLTKVLEADPSINTNGLSFSFSFAAQGDPDNATTTAAESPAIDTITLTATAMSSDTQLLTSTGFIPAATSYPHAGMYAYLVYESAVPSAHPNGSTPATSEAQYLMRVYVDNVEENGAYTGALTIRGVTVERTAADIPPGRQTLGKVNPVPSGANDAGGFAFTNIYTKAADLTISKSVKGASADRTKHFSYSMSFVIPAAQQRSVAQTYTGTITSASGSAIDSADKGHASGATVTFTVTAGQRTSDTQKFELCHGERLVLSLPTGTTYEIVETGAAGYAPTATITNAFQGANVSGSVTGASGATVTVDDSVSYDDNGTTRSLNIVPADGGAVAFTNAYTAPTPTGIIVANLPYILMIGIPVAALVAWFAIRRRKSPRA